MNMNKLIPAIAAALNATCVIDDYWCNINGDDFSLAIRAQNKRGSNCNLNEVEAEKDIKLVISTAHPKLIYKNYIGESDTINIGSHQDVKKIVAGIQRRILDQAKARFALYADRMAKETQFRDDLLELRAFVESTYTFELVDAYGDHATRFGTRVRSRQHSELLILSLNAETDSLNFTLELDTLNLTPYAELGDNDRRFVPREISSWKAGARYDLKYLSLTAAEVKELIFMFITHSGMQDPKRTERKVKVA